MFLICHLHTIRYDIVWFIFFLFSNILAAKTRLLLKKSEHKNVVAPCDWGHVAKLKFDFLPLIYLSPEVQQSTEIGKCYQQHDQMMSERHSRFYCLTAAFMEWWNTFSSLYKMFKDHYCPTGPLSETGNWTKW